MTYAGVSLVPIIYHPRLWVKSQLAGCTPLGMLRLSSFVGATVLFLGGCMEDQRKTTKAPLVKTCLRQLSNMGMPCWYGTQQKRLFPFVFLYDHRNGDTLKERHGPVFAGTLKKDWLKGRPKGNTLFFLGGGSTHVHLSMRKGKMLDPWGWFE